MRDVDCVVQLAHSRGSIRLHDANPGGGDLLAFAPAVGYVGSKAGQAVGLLSKNCFVAGTLVAVGLEDGQIIARPIEAIAVGDTVLARSELAPEGPLEEGRVSQVFVRTTVALQRVTILHEGGTTQTLQTTPEHPFCVEGRWWTQARDLRPGDLLLTPEEGRGVENRSSPARQASGRGVGPGPVVTTSDTSSSRVCKRIVAHERRALGGPAAGWGFRDRRRRLGVEALALVASHQWHQRGSPVGEGEGGRGLRRRGSDALAGRRGSGRSSSRWGMWARWAREGDDGKAECPQRPKRTSIHKITPSCVFFAIGYNLGGA